MLSNVTATLKKDNAIQTFLLVMCYGIAFHIVQLLLYKMGLSSVLPDPVTLERYDAGIYHRASQLGFYYNNDHDNNSGIYLLFPWVWRLLHVGIMGMAFFNLVFFAIGFTLITRIYPISSADKILWLTTPSLYFMWVPYSEALFCLLGAIAFYGIATKNKWLIWGGLFFISLNRATAVFLIPSLFVMELLTNERKDLLKTLYHYFIYYALPTLAGTFVFVFLQYYYSGIWFLYFKEQEKNLGHELSIPALPFGNVYGGDRVTWLCALAMLPCVIAIILLVRKGYKWLVKNKVYTDKVWVLTLGYLPVVLFTMVFCNPKWGTGRTNLLGIHRYVFCSPFIFVFLYHIVSKPREYKPKHFIAVFLLSNLVWLSMGSYWHIQVLLFYNFNTLLVMAYMLHANKKTTWVTAALCAANFFFQVSLYQQFLSNLFTD